MPYEFVLRSPEKVEIRYEIGGIGSRALAAVLDDLIVLTLVGLMGLFLIALEETLGALTSMLTVLGEGWSLALTLFLGYVMWFGYYIGFEILWNGQTPAKRLLGLRVMKIDGTPVTPQAVFIRELLRIVDALPICIFGYSVAGLVAFFNPYGQRIGDMLAGTFVVKERPALAPTLETLSQTYTEQVHPMESELPLVLDLSPSDYRNLKAFLDRRDQIAPEYRRQLAQELYDYLTQKLGMTPSEQHSHEGILEAIATRYARERGRLE
ncbi:MAG: RDD family protein [Fimbriimonadales bacterium]